MMRKKAEILLFSVILFLLPCLMMTACTPEDPHSWPTSGIGASVPEPEAGTVQIAVTKEDGEGKDYSIVIVEDFDAYDMGDYIRLLLKKGFITSGEQMRHEEAKTITYSAKKKNGVTVCLELNFETNELRIEIE